jgi:hypothetical protein
MTAKLWALLAALALVGLAIWGAITWHDNKVDAIYTGGLEAGRKEVQAQWDKAVDEAKATQAAQNEEATTTAAVEVEVIRTVFRDRIKEVTRYVPNPDTHCPADDDFVRLFNGGAASPTDQTADQ